MRNLNECIMMMSDFCYDENERIQDLKLDILDFEVGLVNNKRQKLLREHGIFTDCARILKVLNRNFLNDNKVVHELLKDFKCEFEIRKARRKVSSRKF